MKSTKQIEKETVVVSVGVPVELYYRMKFEAEKHGYNDMSKYLRGLLINHFCEAGFSTEEVK